MDQNVSAAVPGVTTIEQIEECTAVMGASFSKENINELKKYHSFLQGRICTMCGGCIGECPYGVIRSDLLRLVMYQDGYENRSIVKESLPFISRQDIQRCSECSSCSIICRRGLDMKTQIRMAREIIGQSSESIIRS
jgi:ferredoxin